MPSSRDSRSVFISRSSTSVRAELASRRVPGVEPHAVRRFVHVDLAEADLAAVILQAEPALQVPMLHLGQLDGVRLLHQLAVDPGA